MILNNYKILKYAMTVINPTGTGSKYGGDSTFQNGNIRLTFTDGVQSSSDQTKLIKVLGWTTTGNADAWRNVLNPNASASPWVGIVGSGNTPVKPTDYLLSQDITSNFTARTNTFSVSLDENCNMVITATLTGINGITSTQTIKEFGLIVENATGNSATYRHQILLIREVLDTPLVIKPGAGYRIVAEIVENVT